MTKADLILACIAKHPRLTNKEIADRLGLDRKYVSQVKRKHGLTEPKTEFYTRNYHLRMSEEMYQWLDRTRPPTLPFAEFVRIIIREAMEE